MSDKKRETRVYLPRSTMIMGMVVTVEQIAAERGLSFGKALELMLLESVTYNDKMDALKKDAPWLYEGGDSGE